MKHNKNETISKQERNFKWKNAKKVINNGKKGTYKNILFAFQPSDEWKFRINLTKQVKPAVRRNYIKRIIREVYRTSKPHFNKQFQVVFTVINNCNNINFANFKSKYLKSLKNADNK